MQNAIIEYAAENHYMIRPQLVNALKRFKLTDEGKRVMPDCENYYDVWTRRLSDKFFDMSTLIRIATSVELVLRDFYMLKKGYLTISDLSSSPEYKQGIFQRIMPWSNDGAIDLFNSIGIDLNSLPHFHLIQQVMLHRHLYAHNSGLIDNKYIEDLRRLTNLDLLADKSLLGNYPNEDIFYFHPLGMIKEYIEAVRQFSIALK